MATNATDIQMTEQLDAGTASALRINRRIENDEIPLFMQRCVIDATNGRSTGHGTINGGLKTATEMVLL